MALAKKESKSVKDGFSAGSVTHVGGEGAGRIQPASPSNVLIVTVTKTEAAAVLDLFPTAAGTPWERRTIDGKIYYALGEVGGIQVFMVQSEMGTSGPGAALLTIYKALEALSPVAVIMVGIAFGTRPNEHALGDILVSRQLQSYEPQKVRGRRKPIPRGDRVTASPSLLDKFRSGDHDWPGAKVHFGVILSGEKLVNDATFRQRLLDLEPEAIGGEMEGAGLYVAASDAKVDWILVKAICDWADGNKSDEYQQIAARNAAAFTLHVLKQGGLGAKTSPKPTPDNLPPKAYQSLVGRTAERDRIMGILRDPQSLPIAAIFGLGGIGKTALAREVAGLCAQDKLFDYVVWASAKTEYFVGEETTRTGIFAYTFDDLLSDIGRQCDRPGIVQLPPNRKLEAVKNLLAERRVLVVMDNLETIAESKNLVTDVYPVLGQSKLLLTSRHRIEHDRVFTLTLTGLPEDDGVTFLREEGKQRGIEAVVQASDSVLVEVQQVTGGAPLAMKLVVGQISRLPLQKVLEALKKAAFKGQDYPFYRFVYQHSWDSLEKDNDINAQMALVDMSVFPPVTGGAVDDVKAVSQVEPEALWLAMDRLVTLSLVDKTGAAGRERYALHPLTQYFIRSDITQEWAAQ